MFAWLPLVASMVSVLAVASGQPEELPAIGKKSGPEVSSARLCIYFSFLIKYLSQINTKNSTNNSGKRPWNGIGLRSSDGHWTSREVAHQSRK